MISIQRFITHYALTFATLSYITGILLHSTLKGHELAGRIFLLGVITAALSLRFIGSRFPTPLLIIPIFFFFGTLQGAENRSETVDPAHIVVTVKDQQRIVVVGTLSEMVSESIHTSRAVVEVKFTERLRTVHSPGKTVRFCSSSGDPGPQPSSPVNPSS